MHYKIIQILKWNKKEENGLRDTDDNKKLLQLSRALKAYNLLLTLHILQCVLSALDEHPCWSFLANKSKSSDRAAPVSASSPLKFSHLWPLRQKHRELFARRIERKKRGYEKKNNNPHLFERWEIWYQINSDYPGSGRGSCSVVCHPQELLGPCSFWICHWSELAAPRRQPRWSTCFAHSRLRHGCTTERCLGLVERRVQEPANPWQSLTTSRGRRHFGHKQRVI